MILLLRAVAQYTRLAHRRILYARYVLLVSIFSKFTKTRVIHISINFDIFPVFARQSQSQSLVSPSRKASYPPSLSLSLLSSRYTLYFYPVHSPMHQSSASLYVNSFAFFPPNTIQRATRLSRDETRSARGSALNSTNPSKLVKHLTRLGGKENPVGEADRRDE